MRSNKGFTLVEIIIVMVSIAILASIAYVSYSGFQKRSAKTAVINDVTHATELVQLEEVRGNKVVELPAELVTTKDVTVEFKQPVTTSSTTVMKYVGLTPVQNGVLFQKICGDLYNESRPDVPSLKYGQGKSMAGVTTNYLWGPSTCNVYNSPTIEFNNSWGGAGGNLNVPITEAGYVAYMNSKVINNSWFPDATEVVHQFYHTVMTRFIDIGGTFPITTFWNPWCSNSSCTPKQTLPPLTSVVIPGPSSPSYDGRFCIEMSHTKYTDIIYHIANGEDQPGEGACPPWL